MLMLRLMDTTGVPIGDVPVTGRFTLPGGTNTANSNGSDDIPGLCTW